MSTLKSFQHQYTKSNEKALASFTLPKAQFPNRNDVIQRTFLTRKLKPLPPPEENEESQWLYPDKIPDANFGIEGHSPEKDLNRAYRRITSSSLFVTPADKDAQLQFLHDKKAKNKKYVLVEESRLAELIKLDEALQKEQALIGKQCSNAVQDYQLPARVPIPATRYAIHNLCEEQMNRARGEIMKLQTEWYKFARQNHYNKPHLFIKDSYVASAPFGQKALKLRLVKEATDTWLLRKERDTMLYEDDLSFLTCVYYDALQRQRDYERYYILATRYGPFAEEEFYKDSFPGKRYYRTVTKSAIKIQLCWDRYWAVMKLRRYRAARTLQKYWRRYHIYKQIHPIIKLRLKIGKKTYYRFCWARWIEYNAIVRRIKGLLAFQLSNSQQNYFNGWKNYVRDLKRERAEALDRFSRRFKNMAVYNVLSQWKAYTKRIHYLRIKLRRLFGFPHFDLWVEYTQWSKHVKKINTAAVYVQCMFRKWKAKKTVKFRTRARYQVFNFSLILISRLRIKKKRKQLLLTEFFLWKPDEITRRIMKSNEIERQRIQKKQLFIQDKEKQFLKELKKHLNSSNGMEQLKNMVEDYISKKSRLKIGFGKSNLDSVSMSSKYSLGPLTSRSSGIGGGPGGPMLRLENPNAGSSSPLPAGGGGGGSSSPLPAPTLGAGGGGLPSQPSFRGMIRDESNSAMSATSEFQLSNENHDNLQPTGILSWLPFLSSSSRDEYHKKLDLMVKKLKKQCSKVIRIIEGFNYEVKYPPILRCYHPNCMNNFPNEELYHKHIFISENNSYHKLEKDVLAVEQRRFMTELISSVEKELQQYDYEVKFDRYTRTDDETLGLINRRSNRKNCTGKDSSRKHPLMEMKVTAVRLTSNKNKKMLKNSNKSTSRNNLNKKNNKNNINNNNKKNQKITSNKKQRSLKKQISSHQSKRSSTEDSLDTANTEAKETADDLSVTPSLDSVQKESIQVDNNRKKEEENEEEEEEEGDNDDADESDSDEELTSAEVIHCRILEEKLYFLQKFQSYHTTTHFNQLLKNLKGLDIFRNYYLKEYGLSKVINYLDCYLAIQEWKKFNIYQTQYYTKAMNIYEMYLQYSTSSSSSAITNHINYNDGSSHPPIDPMIFIDGNYEALRPLEFLPNMIQQGNQSILTMLCILSQMKEEEITNFPGFYHSTTKKLTTLQTLFHQKPSTYLEWTSKKLLLPTIFQDLELILFQQLYSYYYKDKEFFLSIEFLNYLKTLDDEIVNKNNDFFHDYQNYRLNIISNWSISFKQYELMISEKAEQVIEMITKTLIDEIYLPVEKMTVQERKIEKRHEEQSKYEKMMLICDESVHWVADNAAEYTFDFYVNALLKSMWEIPEYRKGMLQYSGYAKFKLKKKNDVMNNYERMMSNKEKQQENKEWFNNFFSSTSQREKSLLPKDAVASAKRYSMIAKMKSGKSGDNEDEDENDGDPFGFNPKKAVTQIQKRIRGFLDRKKARIEFAKTYKKYYDDNAKTHYYYNTNTQETSWTPPSLFKKLYPNARKW